MKPVRSFIAIEIPGSQRDAIATAGRQIWRRLPPKAIRWVRPENIHLTLRFLGDTPISKLELIGQGLGRITPQIAPFEVSLGELGCFPSKRRPRVIWVGVNSRSEQLTTLHEAITGLLTPLGWPRERRAFHPHLTIGRIREPMAIAGSSAPWGEELVSGRIIVDSVKIIGSELRPDGPMYRILFSSSLGGVGQEGSRIP